MSNLSTTQIDTLREQLQSRLRVLQLEVQAAEAAQREPAASDGHEVGDSKDQAALAQVRDVDGVQEQRDLDEIKQIELALDRLHSGDYGVCADCGDNIALPRLQAQPAALRCTACQTQREAGRVLGHH